MEPLARMTLLGFLARGGGGLVFPRAGGDGTFAAWNGSRASLPFVKKPDASDGGRAKGDENGEWERLLQESLGTPEEPQGPEVLVGQAYTAVMTLQSLVVMALVGFLGVRLMGEDDRDHFKSWNLIWSYACPPLLLLVGLFLAALLIHIIGSLTVVVFLWIQTTGALLATFSGIVLIAAGLGAKNADDDPLGDFVGLLTVLGGSVSTWFVSFGGFLQAFWRWTRIADRKLKQRERGYGTTSGGLAIEDEGIDGLVDA